MKKPFSWYVMKLDRIAAWTLLVTILLYIISGYGMTKGIISLKLATEIHNNWLPLILLASFSFHTCFAISLAFRRWKIWNFATGVVLITFYLLLFGSFIFVNSFHKKPVAVNTNVAQINSSLTTTSSNTNPPTTSSQKVFSAAELAKYNGQKGVPAYVAISGKVYDVTGIFPNGDHHGCTAGQDVTTAFYQIHNNSFLAGLTIVGTYSN